MSFEDFVPAQRFYPTLALSPDGTAVAYSSNRSGQFNLWVQPIDGGPAQQLTDFTDNAVRSLAWSPDGSTIAFEADHHGDEQNQIHVIAASGGPPRRLTSAPDRQHWLANGPFTPDGTALVYAGNDRDPMAQDVLVHNLQTGQLRRIERTEGSMLYGGSVSPDGQWLQTMALRSNTDIACALVDLTDEHAKPRVVVPDGEESVCHVGPWSADSAGCYVRTSAGSEFTSLAYYRIADDRLETVQQPGWDVEEVASSADGRTLAWVVNEDGRSQLHVARDGVPLAPPSLPLGVIVELTLSGDGTLAAFLFNTPTRPTEVVVVDLTSGELRYLTESRPAGLTEFEPVEPELVRFPTHDAKFIPAWLFRPRSSQPAPVLLSIHGGPEAQERPAYLYSGLYQYLLSQGIGVLAPNVRGSTGYGKSYQKLIHRDFGGAELGDFEHAARYLQTLGWVRPDRLGVCGGSYGGFATLSCVSRLPSLWAAGVSIVGPSNLVTFARSVPPTWRSFMAKWVGDPETETDFLMSRSPITYADDIVAPLFIVQGAKDPRVVQAESDQIVAKLRARGVEVRYDVYPDEGHGFTSRANELRAFSRIADFLHHHLLT